MSDKPNQPERSADELLKMAKQLSERAENGMNAAKKATPDKSAVERVVDNTAEAVTELRGFNRTATATARTYSTVRDILSFIYEKGKPVFDFIWDCMCWTGRKYMNFWNKHAYVTNKETGERLLSRKRAGAILAATAVALSAVMPGPVGGFTRARIADTVEEVADTGKMTFFYNKNEILYLSDSNRVAGSEDHEVKACSTNPCNEDSFSLMISPGIAHNIWSMSNGKGLFLPDTIAAKIAPGVNKCEVTYAGARWRFFYWMQAYPNLLDAQCERVSNVFNDKSDAAVKVAQAAPAVIAAPAAKHVQGPKV